MNEELEECLDKLERYQGQFYLKGITLVIQNILREVYENKPTGYTRLSKIVKLVNEALGKDELKKLEEAGIRQGMVNHRIRGIVSSDFGKSYFVKPREVRGKYRLNADHPKVKRWLEEKLYKKNITIGGYQFTE